MKAVDEVKQFLSRYTSLPSNYEQDRIDLAKQVDVYVSTKVYLVQGNISELRDLVRWKRNTVGNILGIGGCFHCGDRWNWKKAHCIPYFGEGGMFPYCEECHRSISGLAKMQHILELVMEWTKQYPRGLWYCNGEHFYHLKRLIVAWINVLRGL
jgi:hypothetical protein